MGKKTQKLKVGDFFQGKLSPDSRDMFGIVTSIEPFSNYLDLLDYCSLRRTDPVCVVNLWPEDEDVQKLSKKEALEVLKRTGESFQEEINEGGLAGALVARRQYLLERVVQYLQKTSKPQLITKRTFPVPETGVYVVEGIYGFQQIQNLDGLVLEPRRSEDRVAEMMKVLCPGGTENISAEDRVGRNREKLKGYRAYEVPEKAIHLVENPITLKIDLYRDPVV